MTYLSPFLSAVLASVVIVVVGRRGSAVMVWRTALVGGGADAIIFLIGDYPYPESSPVALILAALSPWLVSSAIALAGRRVPWYLLWPAAATLSIVLTPPSYLVGCVISDLLPVPGCFI